MKSASAVDTDAINNIAATSSLVDHFWHNCCILPTRQHHCGWYVYYPPFRPQHRSLVDTNTAKHYPILIQMPVLISVGAEPVMAVMLFRPDTSTYNTNWLIS
eukprot:scaffold41646_cov41-Cyclotella_meneghiniana.AAC.1